MAKQPPKTLPKDLSWGAVDKSLNLFKTSLLQKVGKQEAKTVPPEFTSASEKVQQLNDLLENLIKQAKHYTKTFIAISEGATQYAKALQEFSTVLPQNDVLAPALAKFHDVQMEIEEYRLKYKDQFLSTLIGTTEKFILGEISEFKEAQKQWKKARLEHDAAKSKLEGIIKSSSAKPVEPLGLFLAQTHYHVARKREALKFESALDKVTDVLWLRDFNFLSENVKCMEALHQYILYSYNALYQLEEYLKQLQEHCVSRRADYLKEKEKKLAEKKAKELDEYNNRYNALVELLSAEDLAVVNAVCVTAGSEQETILESLVNILDAHKVTLPIIKLGITKEVEKTSNATTLFRGNTMATKLMTSFTRMTGRNYLTNTIKPLLDQVQELINKGGSFEVDPQKSKPDEKLDENMLNLKTTSQQFLNAIVESYNACPLPFRVMASHLRTEVVKSFPEAKYSSVGGFIFLRFFCPAILSPDSTNPPLITKVDPALRRALILISKSLQNLANGIEFGAKEPFMQDMNTFIKENKEVVENFFDKLAAPVTNEDYEPLCSRDVAVQKELPALHTKIVQNLDKIGKSLVQYKNEDTIPILAVLLAELGEEGITVNPDNIDPKKAKKK